jgi:CheY-like chemotaxis protein
MKKIQGFTGVQPFKNVLLIDDDAMCNMINEKIFKLSKFANKVKSYADAKKALIYMRELIKTDLTQLPEVIFLDINMPGMDGWGFLEELKEFPKFISNGCKVIMLTSSIDQRDIEKSKNYKMVYSFISKPLTEEKLKHLFSLQEEVLNNE